MSPIKIDIGQAAQIAGYLRQTGYPRCSADKVTAQLAKPEHERGIIGRVAAAGWRP